MSPYLFVNHSSTTIASNANKKSNFSKRPSSAVVSYVQRGVQRKRRAESLRKLKAAKRPPWFAAGRTHTNEPCGEKGGGREGSGGGGGAERDHRRKNVPLVVGETASGRREVGRREEEDVWKDEVTGIRGTEEFRDGSEKNLKWQLPTCMALISSPKTRYNNISGSPTLSVNSPSDSSTTSSETLAQPYGYHSPVATSYSHSLHQSTEYVTSHTQPFLPYRSYSPPLHFFHGSSDPFHTTSHPLGITPSVTRLFSYLQHTLPTYWIPRDTSRRFSLTESDISAALHCVNPTQMDALLAMASALVAGHLRRDGFGKDHPLGLGEERYRQQQKQTLVFTGRGVKGLRRSLDAPTTDNPSLSPSPSPSKTALLDQTLTTILSLSRSAGYDGDEHTATLHMFALKKLVDANGGLRAKGGCMHPLRAECAVAFDVKLAGMGMSSGNTFRIRRTVWEPVGEWDFDINNSGYGCLDENRREAMGLRRVPARDEISLGRRFLEEDDDEKEGKPFPRYEASFRTIIRSLLDVVRVYDYISAHPSAVSRDDPVHRWLHLRPVACEARLLDYYCSLPPSTSTSDDADDGESSTSTSIQTKRLSAVAIILWLNLSLDNPILPNIRKRLCGHLRRALLPLLPLADSNRFIGELLLFSAFLGTMCEANVPNPLRPSLVPFFERDDEVEGGWWAGVFARVREMLGLRRGYGEVKRVLEGFLFLERLGGEVLRGLLRVKDEEEGQGEGETREEWEEEGKDG